MTTYKKQLKDKDGNTIYPDVGLNLDDVVYSDTPEEVELEPWVDTTEIVDGAVTTEKIADDAVTSDKVNLTWALGTGTSITIPSTGVWFVTHTLQYGQANATTTMVLIYTLTNFYGSTILACAANNTQELWGRCTENQIMSITSANTLLSRTTTTSENASVHSERWLAVKIG